MNITIDTNFLISAMQWDNSVAFKLLRRFLETNIKIFTTKKILDEFSEVLQRDFKYNKEETTNILEEVLAFVNLIEAKEKIKIVKEDPDDDKIIECAVASNSNYIITYDKHLLKIKEYKSIKIITPEEMLKLKIKQSLFYKMIYLLTKWFKNWRS